MSSCLGLYYTKRSGNCIHRKFIFIFFCAVIKGFFLHTLYDIKYSYQIQIIYTQLYGFKYSYLLQIFYTQLYGFKNNHLSANSQNIKYSYLIHGKSCGVVVNMLNCDLIVSLNSSHTITFPFRLIPFRKVWTTLSPTRNGLNCINTVYFHIDGFSIK